MSWQASPVCGHWRIDATGGTVLITAVPPDHAVADHVWQPRVSPKVGLGVPLAGVPSLVAAIANAAATGPGANPWSPPGIDHTEGFVYVQGPVGALEEFTGYRPLRRFVVTPHDLFGLGQRLSALITASTGRA
ncbi:hypothetical protein [Actinophytocola sp. KF-1]